MKPDGLLSIFHECSTRLSKEQNRCGHLIYPYTKSSKEPIIREPETRMVMCQILVEMGLDYGIETPTSGLYSISGEKKDVANIDLVIYAGSEQINIEFKDGQPSEEKISKDFKKFIEEPCSATAFFHILQNANKKTIPKLLEKYQTAYGKEDKNNGKPKWFMLYIYIKNQNRSFYSSPKDILKLEADEFFEKKLNEYVIGKN